MLFVFIFIIIIISKSKKKNVAIESCRCWAAFIARRADRGGDRVESQRSYHRRVASSKVLRFINFLIRIGNSNVFTVFVRICVCVFFFTAWINWCLRWRLTLHRLRRRRSKRSQRSRCPHSTTSLAASSASTIAAFLDRAWLAVKCIARNVRCRRPQRNRM